MKQLILKISFVFMLCMIASFISDIYPNYNITIWYLIGVTVGYFILGDKK